MQREDKEFYRLETTFKIIIVLTSESQLIEKFVNKLLLQPKDSGQRVNQQ